MAKAKRRKKLDLDGLNIDAFLSGTEEAIEKEMPWLENGKKDEPVKRCFRRRFVSR